MADPRFISMLVLQLICTAPLCIAYLPHGDLSIYHQVWRRELTNLTLIRIIAKGVRLRCQFTRQPILVCDDVAAARHALAGRVRQIVRR